METKEYDGVSGKLKFFWRFRCIKLRLAIETIGIISIFAFGIIMMIATIYQWYLPNHFMWFYWNRYGEAYIEYIWAVVAFPCSLYTLKMMGGRTLEKWRK